MTDLSLNAHHQDLLNNYIQFARYHRGENLKTIHFAFQNVLDSRLLEATYTAEEVKDLLTTLNEVVCSDMEIELISFTHINVLLIQQLCSQAEKWHLRLQVDLDKLQDQELLQKVKAWDEGKAEPFAGRRPEKLEPLSTEGSHGPILLLRRQIEEIQQENNLKQCTILELQKKIHQLEIEKSQLQNALSTSKLENEKMNSLCMEENMSVSSSHLEEVQSKLSQLSSSLKQTEEGRQEMQSQLSDTHGKLQQVQAQLQLAEQELERKFSQTVAYGNMKKMLSKKNEQMRELRQRLRNYEPDDAAANGDD